MQKVIKTIMSLVDAAGLFALRLALYIGAFWLLAELLGTIVNDVRLHGFS
ncbi:MAG: hypothetical protein HY287_02420 [Planctomycetes bacterium]|nr:hypothetical protein [Planctomycetota bacterium]MBI3833164.1 hypothetical protein [Planctomycetota bacterium]